MNNSTDSTATGLTKPPPLTNEQAEEIIRKATLGADVIELAKIMDGMGLSKDGRDTAAMLIGEFFAQMAEFDPRAEMGRARARLDALFLASWRIQDFKGCLAVQQEINKLTKLRR